VHDESYHSETAIIVGDLFRSASTPNRRRVDQSAMREGGRSNSVEITPGSLGRFVATAIATGWLVVGSVTRDTPDDRAPRSATEPRPAAPAPSFTYSQELRARLNRREAPEPGRNPFVYGSRQVAPPAARRDTAVEPAIPVPPAEPPPPHVKLSGIAMTEQDGVKIFTAIVIENGVMVLGKAGDRLPSGGVIVRVDELSVTLADVMGITQTLRLP
jgi:hypothetical protein